MGTLFLLLLGAVLASLMVGRFALSPSTIARVLAARITGGTVEGNLVQADNVFFIIRLPLAQRQEGVGMNIVLDNVGCGYGKNTILQNIDIEVLAREILYLVGPNGIGKSTLFKTILGFLPA
jgi:ABC-type multidrug transport system fused ATPase/permease subunit